MKDTIIKIAVGILIGILLILSIVTCQRNKSESQKVDSLRTSSNKIILEKELELRESEKEIRLLKSEKEEILKRETKLKAQIASTPKISSYKPKYVPCDTTKAVAEESYNELKQGAETVEKQRDSASVLLNEKEKLIVNTAEAEKAEDVAQNGLLNEKDKQLSLEKKEAKKAKRKAFWNGVKTTLVVVGCVVITIVFL